MEQTKWKNNLKAIRKEKGLTQRQVAELIGLKCQNRLCRWEKGVSVPSLQNLLKLSELYTIEIGQFIEPKFQ